MFFTKANLGKNDWWRYLFLFLIVFLILPLFLFVFSEINFWLPSFGGNLELSKDLNVIMLVQVLPFVAAFIFMLLVFPIIHDRDWRSLFSPLMEFNWWKVIKYVSIFVFILVGIELMVYYFGVSEYLMDYKGSKFWILLFMAFVLFPFQAGFEELIFRSYLLQGFGILFKNKIIAILMTSFLFASLHMANPEVLEYGYVSPFLYYFMTGTFLAIIVVMEDNLFLSWAFHTANNIVAAVFFTYQGAAIETYALFKTPHLDIDNMLIQAIISFAIILFILHKVRKWGSWRVFLEPIRTNIPIASSDELLFNDLD